MPGEGIESSRVTRKFPQILILNFDRYLESTFILITSFSVNFLVYFINWELIRDHVLLYYHHRSPISTFTFRIWATFANLQITEPPSLIGFVIKNKGWWKMNFRLGIIYSNEDDNWYCYFDIPRSLWISSNCIQIHFRTLRRFLVRKSYELRPMYFVFIEIPNSI